MRGGRCVCVGGGREREKGLVVCFPVVCVGLLEEIGEKKKRKVYKMILSLSCLVTLKKMCGIGCAG